MVRVALGAVAVLAAAVAISFIASGQRSRRGCIAATVPYSLGGQQLDQCGAAARATCRAIGTPAGFSGAAGRAVAPECRKAGLPVGPGSRYGP
jgi:hypothetical protein